MEHKKYIWLLSLWLVLFLSCSVPDIQQYKDTGRYPDLFPDYINVTIPCNIAPLNFHLNHQINNGVTYLEGNGVRLKISSSDGKFRINERGWKKLLKKNKGGSIKVTIFTKEGKSWEKYNPFSILVSADPIDPYVVYRLIEPGYELWNKMGIYQRNLETFKESAIYENKMTSYNCVNCHSFCMGNPKEMMFHLRGQYGGTILIKNEAMEKLNTKTDSTISSLVYPYWHPSGKYIAFSVNKIDQTFYLNNRDRIEVFDSESNVVMYDTERHQIFTSPLLATKARLETFPSFSPDGKTLFFCSAKAKPVPEKSDSVKYSLCSIPFYSETRTFGSTVDTLFNATNTDKSASFPRISPDGRFLLFTAARYGTFPIWHKEADLILYDLKTKEYKDMSKVNSPDVDSYHSWSSNSRWIIFSSRRGDGLYTRLYIAHVGEDGVTEKAFMLPQKDSRFYEAFMKSYNIPELVKGPVNADSYNISQMAKNSDGILVKYNGTKETIGR